MIQNLRKDVEFFYKISDVISMIDIVFALSSYAQSTSSTHCTAPIFDERLHLENSIHPILENINQQRNLKNSIFKSSSTSNAVTNNITASETHPFVILTGANMSGKSTLLKQIGILQIMSQCGSFIPASKGIFNVTKKILSRARDVNDNLNESSFEHEMLEMKYILENMNTDCLILIDELCRSTNFNEGLALTIAICEFMLETISKNLYKKDQKIFVIFASHYAEISCLEYIYQKVNGFCLESFFDKKLRLKHSYKLNRGYCKNENYGKFYF